MRKLLLSLSIVATLFGATAVLQAPANAADVLPVCSTLQARAQAQNGNSSALPHVCQDVNAQNTTKTNPILGMLRNIINIASYVVGVAAIIMIIVNGLRLTLSAGDTNAINSARSGIIFAAVGLVIAGIAQTIVVFVLNNS